MTRDKDNTSTLYLCSCCTIWEANRDASGCEYACESSEHPAGLMGQFTSEEISLGIFWEDHEPDCPNHLAAAWVAECDCERIDFSSHQCDGCGSYLAGSRDLATLWHGAS